MRHKINLISLISLSFFCCSNLSFAADEFDINLKELPKHPEQYEINLKDLPRQPDQFEINLKDLHHPPSKKQTTTRKPNKTERSETAATAGKGTSFYTVRPGDHLFIILMRHYHLSNKAAENLIPEVMRLNNISSPHGLTIGQRLAIPLSALEKTVQTEHKANKSRRNSLASTQPEAETRGEKPDTSEARDAELTTPKKKVVPGPAAVAQAPQPAPIPQQLQKQLGTKDVQLPAPATIPAAPACELAREMAERLGLLEPDQIKPQPGQQIFTAMNAGRKVVVACGLSPAEIYTYGRLLSKDEFSLLAFNGNEPRSRVVEKFAAPLGLDYEPVSPDASEDLPLDYSFSKIGHKHLSMHLIIAPAVKQ